MQKKSIRYKWSGHSLDRKSTVFVKEAVFLSGLFLIAGFILVLNILWRDLPFFPMAQGEPVTLMVQNHVTDRWGYPEVITKEHIFTGHKAQALKEEYGATRAFNPIHGLVVFEIFNHISFLQNWLQSDTYTAYKLYLEYAESNNQLTNILYRWIGSVFGAILFSWLGLWLGLKAVYHYENQVTGKILRRGKEAYNHLKQVFNHQISNNDYPSLTIESDLGFDPKDPDTFENLKLSQKICIPDVQRRSHILTIAGTRRGKTQRLLKFLMEIYHYIKKGLNYKLVILDTPKSDYLRFINKKHVYNIAPDAKDGVVWNMPRDLALKSDVAQYWKGQIPDSKNSNGDDFWTKAPRLIGQACHVACNNEYGEDYGFGILSYTMKLPPDQLIELVKEHYYEAYRIVTMGENPISSVLGSLEANCSSFVPLAEIWEGFQYKHDIIQMATRTMKHEKAIERLSQHRFPLDETKNYGANTVFRGLIRHMNQTTGNNWKWLDLSNALHDNYKNIFTKSSSHLTLDESRMFINTGIFNLIVLQCRSCFNVAWCNNKEQFEEFLLLENGEKVSPFKPKQFLDEKDFLSYFTIILADPSGAVDKKDMNLLIALYRKYGKNFWKAFQQLVIQYNENDNISQFIQAMAESLTSNELSYLFDDKQNDFSVLIEGCKPIFEWHTVWDEYEAMPRFSFKDWLYDENPKKKIVCFSPSGRAKDLVQGLTRGLMMFMTGIINDGYFRDDKQEAGKENIRNFYIFADELQSLGHMGEFLKPALELFASRGITLIMACQDVSQLIELYTQETVDFILGNVGNVFCIGNTIGVTPEKIAGLLGKKSLQIHEISKSTDAASGSSNFQESFKIVNDEWIMTPDQINSELGLNVMEKINAWENKVRETFGFRKKSMPIRYLYLPSNIEGAYLLSTPVTKYKVEYVKEMPDWMKNIKRQPDPVNIKTIIKKFTVKDTLPTGSSSAGGSTSTATEDKQQEKPKAMQWQAVEPESKLTQSLWVQEPTGDIPDDDLEPPTQAYDLTQYEAELEAVELGTDIVQDMALEHISASTHVEAIKVIKDIAEVLEGSGKPKATTSKAYADKIKQKAIDARKGREAFIVRGDDPFDRKR